MPGLGDRGVLTIYENGYTPDDRAPARPAPGECRHKCKLDTQSNWFDCQHNTTLGALLSGRALNADTEPTRKRILARQLLCVCATGLVVGKIAAYLLVNNGAN